MSQRQSRWRGRPARLIAGAAGSLTLALAGGCVPAGADTLAGAPLASAAKLPHAASKVVSYIVGGQPTPIADYPWQVFVFTEKAEKSLECGGAILDATTIITAAHCVTHEHTTIPYPAEDTLVVAGASEINVESGLVLPASHQEVHVATTTIDPNYAVEPVKDDVAVLTLTKGLALAPGFNTASIPLVDVGATPPPGTTLTLSGYGRTSSEVPSKGKLNTTTLTALSSDACRKSVGVNSAVLLCAQSVTSSACDGDSGGPLIEGTPAVLVGLVDTVTLEEGKEGCSPGFPNVFTNLAAPEIRAFIEREATIPLAARVSSLPVIKSVGTGPLDYSPVTCEPGVWSGSPSFTYTFALENDVGGKTLQSGSSALFLPTRADVGEPLVCIVQASNAGGVSTARSATTSPIQPDTTPPESSITAPPACHQHSCTITIDVTDPDGVAVQLKASASYATACVASRATAKAPCSHTKTVPMQLSSQSVDAYQASTAGLPYGEKIRFRVLATNAAGLAQSAPAVRTVTLH